MHPVPTPSERVQQLASLIQRSHAGQGDPAAVHVLTQRLLAEGLVGPGELLRMHAQAAAGAVSSR